MKSFSYQKNLLQSVPVKTLPDTSVVISDAFARLADAFQPFSLSDRRAVMVLEKAFADFYLQELTAFFDEACISFTCFVYDDTAEQSAERFQDTLKEALITESDCLITAGTERAVCFAQEAAGDLLSAMLWVDLPLTLFAQTCPMLSTERTWDTAKHGTELYHPNLIYINLFAYKNSTETERNSGMGEILRIAAAADDAMFLYLEQNIGKKSEDMFRFLLQLVANCVLHNAESAANRYGLLVAEALEICTDHYVVHGQAAAVGMVVANNLAAQKGFLKEDVSFRMAKALVSYGLPVSMNFTNDLIDAICAAFPQIKDAKSPDTYPFSIIKKIGKTDAALQITADDIRAAMYYRS